MLRKRGKKTKSVTLRDVAGQLRPLPVTDKAVLRGRHLFNFHLGNRRGTVLLEQWSVMVPEKGRK